MSSQVTMQEILNDSEKSRQLREYMLNDPKMMNNWMDSMMNDPPIETTNV